MKKREALKKFLVRSGSPLAHLYTPEMEVQVNVAKDNGVRVTGEYKQRRWRGWQDTKTGEIWKAFRIPWNADSDPTYKDSELRWDLAEHVEGVGMTGWDWENRQSLWVGYDFDAITNHQEGLEKEVLDELIEKTSKIPWVSLLRSTSGNGIHVYIFFDKPVATANHNEHAALARSLMSLLTIQTGFNFKTTVDCVGMVLWCYHRKQEGTNGLTWIKEGDKFPTSLVPKNWKEHVEVTSRASKKVQRKGNLESLSSMGMEMFLEEDHHKILQWFHADAKKDWWWDTDYTMLVCHTKDLEACHQALGLKGIFTTNTSSSSDQNCFAFPNRGGSFAVRRHGKNVNESDTWTTDQLGWTKCVFNADPGFEDACAVGGALENEKLEKVFNTLEEAEKSLKLLKIDLVYPEYLKHRPSDLKRKGVKVILKVKMESADAHVDGFLRGKTHWIKTFNYKEDREEVHIQDSLVRHVISNGADAGWYVNINESWVYQPKTNVKSVLVAEMIGMKGQDIEQLLGKSIREPYILQNRPFDEEYLGGRLWNKDAAQLAFRPTQGKTDTWWELLDHVGSGLDEAVSKDRWCQDNGISNGGEYLFLWFSSMFQRPLEPLPYLFLFGEQKTGKSTLHEAFSLFFKRRVGYSRADQALKDKTGFNYEIAHSVLCVIEETDLAHNRTAGNRIKDWVTGKTIAIREMYKNTYEIDNSTHWLQCSNDANACPIFRGDTRIVAMEVPPLEKEIPKPKLMTQLEAEAPALLYEMVNYMLPEPEGRLMIPCISTDVKEYIMEDNFNALQSFIEEMTVPVVGHLTSMEEFFSAFNAWLLNNAPNEQYDWTPRKVSMEFPRVAPVVKGKMGSENKAFLGNLSLDLNAEPKDTKYVIHNKDRLREVQIEP